MSPNSETGIRSCPYSPGRDLNRWSSWPCPERTFKSWASAKNWSLPGGADWMRKNEQLFVCIKVGLPDNCLTISGKNLPDLMVYSQVPHWICYLMVSPTFRQTHVSTYKTYSRKAKSGKRQSCCKMTLGARLFVGSDYEFALGSKFPVLRDLFEPQLQKAVISRTGGQPSTKGGAWTTSCSNPGSFTV